MINLRTPVGTHTGVREKGVGAGRAGHTGEGGRGISVVRVIRIIGIVGEKILGLVRGYRVYFGLLNL
jgi:hypothetical protein